MLGILLNRSIPSWLLPASRGSRYAQACGHITPNSAAVATCLIVLPGKSISFYLYKNSCHQTQSLLGESRMMSSLTWSCLQALEHLRSKITFSDFEIICHKDSHFDTGLRSPSPVAIS